MDRHLVARVAGICIAIILIPAGATKAFEVDDFSRQVDQLSLYPHWLRSLIAYNLPWLEIGIGGLALHRAWREPAGALAAGLAVLFSIHLILVSFGNLPSCACMLPVGRSSVAHWIALAVLQTSSLVLTFVATRQEESGI